MTARTSRPTRRIHLGGVAIGGGAPVTIQSMLRTPTQAVAEALEEIRRLAALGCDIVRVAVSGSRDLEPLAQIAGKSGLPVVADVHTPAALAADCLAAGAHGVRINPLVAWPRQELRRLAERARDLRRVVRVGVNAGRWRGLPRPEELVSCVTDFAGELAALGADQLKLSVKASEPGLTRRANELLAEATDWPIHLGLTEAGPAVAGAARSAGVLALLLDQGIGDTIRISLSGPAEQEVLAARGLLESLGLRRRGVRVVACPGCGRAHRDIGAAARYVEQELATLQAELTVAVMGCEINGPGEARAADLGIAATAAGWMLFEGGEPGPRLSPDEGPHVLVARARSQAARTPQK